MESELFSNFKYILRGLNHILVEGASHTRVAFRYGTTISTHLQPHFSRSTASSSALSGKLEEIAKRLERGSRENKIASTSLQVLRRNRG